MRLPVHTSLSTCWLSVCKNRLGILRGIILVPFEDRVVMWGTIDETFDDFYYGKIGHGDALDPYRHNQNL